LSHDEVVNTVDGGWPQHPRLRGESSPDSILIFARASPEPTGRNCQLVGQCRRLRVKAVRSKATAYVRTAGDMLSTGERAGIVSPKQSSLLPPRFVVRFWFRQVHHRIAKCTGPDPQSSLSTLMTASALEKGGLERRRHPSRARQGFDNVSVRARAGFG
jgi:hypothetical protein